VSSTHLIELSLLLNAHSTTDAMTILVEASKACRTLVGCLVGGCVTGLEILILFHLPFHNGDLQLGSIESLVAELGVDCCAFLAEGVFGELIVEVFLFVGLGLVHAGGLDTDTQRRVPFSCSQILQVTLLLLQDSEHSVTECTIWVSSDLHIVLFKGDTDSSAVLKLAPLGMEIGLDSCEGGENFGVIAADKPVDVRGAADDGLRLKLGVDDLDDFGIEVFHHFDGLLGLGGLQCTG
jgi:hypothetical protein